VPARRRTPRDEQRRRLGQNFLRPEYADRLVAEAAFNPGELAVEIGPGRGAITFALARRGVRVLAVELDPAMAEALRHEVRRRGLSDVRVVSRDFAQFSLPRHPFRAVGSLPFGVTTALLRHLLEGTEGTLQRADLIVQWEVAVKRAAVPPSTLVSAGWAPWWQVALGQRIPAQAFHPVPRVDAGLLTITPRDPPILPRSLGPAFREFVRSQWPAR
jgi:23S rRNA (adenine-N6)-dimethyltransferase